MAYNKPVISGYNTSPPADDGSATEDNKVKWSTIKGKIGDPTKLYADAINNASESAWNDLANTVSDTGASLVGVQDVADNFSSNGLEAVLAEIGAKGPFLLDTTDTFTGHLDIIGTASVGLSGTHGTFHILTSSAGGSEASVNSDDLVIENAGEGGLTVLSGAGNDANVTLGSGGNANARIKYNSADVTFRVEAVTANSKMVLSTAGSVAITLTKDQDVGIGALVPLGRTHIDQSDVGGAIPVLYLDQADVSEEFIRFDATEATGNSIEAVASKTLTPTKFVRININGDDLYFEAGTIA